jgi:hypothetical protein
VSGTDFNRASSAGVAAWFNRDIASNVAGLIQRMTGAPDVYQANFAPSGHEHILSAPMAAPSQNQTDGATSHCLTIVDHAHLPLEGSLSHESITG